MARASLRYQSHRDPQEALRMRLRELAAIRVRFGYRRLTVLLRRDGRPVNAKRIYRLYTEEGLMVPDQNASEGSSAAPRPSGCGNCTEPAVEHGFHECAGHRWAVVPNLDRGRPVYAGVPVSCRRSLPQRREGGAGIGACGTGARCAPGHYGRQRERIRQSRRGRLGLSSRDPSGFYSAWETCRERLH